MTNQVEIIVAAITDKLKAAGINTVYRWPEEMQKVGNRYPLALIKEERQDYTLTSGQRYEYILTLSITLVSDVLRNRMQYMNYLQATVFRALFATADLGGVCMHTNPVRVEMGGLVSGSDLSAYPGFSESATFRRIEIQCLVEDTRL